jgi:hypothetical protein
MNDENRRQLRRHRRTRILTERPDEIAPDIAISFGRLDRFIARSDALVIFAHLLAQCVVWHEPVDNRRCSKSCNCESRHFIEKFTAADFSVNVT